MKVWKNFFKANKITNSGLFFFSGVSVLLLLQMWTNAPTAPAKMAQHVSITTEVTYVSVTPDGLANRAIKVRLTLSLGSVDKLKLVAQERRHTKRQFPPYSFRHRRVQIKPLSERSHVWKQRRGIHVQVWCWIWRKTLRGEWVSKEIYP